MSRHQDFSDGIGLSRHEQADIAGKALGGHLWDSMMEPFGGESGFRNSLHSENYDKFRESGYDIESIKFNKDDNNAPYVEHSSGPYRAKWHGGTYADIHHVSDPSTAIDTLNVGHKGEPGKGSDLQSRLENWHNETAQYYR